MDVDAERRAIVSTRPLGESPARVLKRLEARDHIVRIPQQYILCARVSLLLRGMSQLMVQRPIAIAPLWEAEARRALRTISDTAEASNATAAIVTSR